MAESEKSIAQSEIFFENATRANTISDRYSLLTVIFSMVMFLAAIGAKDPLASAQAAILGGGIVAVENAVPV